MRDLYVLRALVEGRYKWNPCVKSYRRGTPFEGNIRLTTRAAREYQKNLAALQNVDYGLNRTW